MAATGRQMNWTGVGFTPTGGSLTTFTGVTSVTINLGGTLVGFAGDTDKFDTTLVNSMNAPTMTIQSGNPAQFMGLAPGTIGALTATHNDAKSASGGAIVYALSNATVDSPQTGGQHAQFGTGSVTFKAFSSDGSTNPLAFTRS